MGGGPCKAVVGVGPTGLQEVRAPVGPYRPWGGQMAEGFPVWGSLPASTPMELGFQVCILEQAMELCSTDL